MTHIYASIGSVTTAARFARDLERHGIRAEVVHTPTKINAGGCSYSVRVDKKYKKELLMIAEMKKYRLKKLYRIEEGEAVIDLS